MKKRSAQELIAQVEASQPRVEVLVPDGYTVRDFSLPLKEAGNTGAVEGCYIGPGPEKKIKGKAVKTYVVKRDVDGVRVSVVATWQLEQFFESLDPGKWDVYVAKVGQVKGGQFGRVNEYLTAAKPHEGGESV